MSSSEQTLSPLNRQLLSHYEMVRGMVSRLAEDFTAEEAVTRAGDLKPLVWYLGHIAQTEAFFLKLFGDTDVALSEEHVTRFGRGSDGSLDHFGGWFGSGCGRQQRGGNKRGNCGFHDIPRTTRWYCCASPQNRDRLKYFTATRPAVTRIPKAIS